MVDLRFLQDIEHQPLLGGTRWKVAADDQVGGYTELASHVEHLGARAIAHDHGNFRAQPAFPHRFQDRARIRPTARGHDADSHQAPTGPITRGRAPPPRLRAAPPSRQ